MTPLVSVTGRWIHEVFPPVPRHRRWKNGSIRITLPPRIPLRLALLHAPMRPPDTEKFRQPSLPSTLADILPGSWQVRIQTPFALATMQVVLTKQGSFRGELIAPTGAAIAEGHWTVNAPERQIALEGRSADSSHLTPYSLVVHVTFFDRQQIVGVSDSGEQVTWHKATPAA